MAIATLGGRRIRIQGTVQGVGFRPWVYRTAHLAGVTGCVRNDSAGVTIEAFGDDDALRRFLDALQFPPPAARILALDETAITPETVAGFTIVESDQAAERRVSIPPDLATCDECVRDIFDPSNRRYRYPFTNCTNCGPRFTIAFDIPYDRRATTMAPFTMCPACQKEYEDVGDRRFHAQPNACPLCGPQLMLHASDGARIHADDAIAVAAQALREGLIVAVKGIGGVHLACDATSEAAVARLRQRKRRDEKPLAVMVRDLAAAAAVARLHDEERRLLTSVEHPIVLASKRPASVLADAVAPNNRMVGIFLPYSPLHHLLLADAGRPLVMTSGNLSDEPIAYRNDEAIRRLGSIADLFVLHDREIETRCDDSVIAAIDGRGTVLRRSRGFVPRAVPVRRAFSRPVLACGALLKNTFCIGSSRNAWLGPHIGDLENLETYESYEAAIARMERFLEVQPAVVAHDMHPDYLSTAYARSRPEALKVSVQHHHAHVVSAMAEHDIDGPAIGIAYDGTGYGMDGTSWGGEILIATPLDFRRVATFRPLRLVGGDTAIRQPWRIALALMLDTYADARHLDIRALFNFVPEREFQAIDALLRRGVEAPLARGVGRYFDAFGALFLGRYSTTFEGQVALEWNQAADPLVADTYPFDIHDDGEIYELDLRRSLRRALRDRAAGESTGTIAAAFHNTLAAATAALVGKVVSREGRFPIVASGGCFQNARLAEGVRAALAPEHEVFLHENVPPGDGGIALGQAVIANAQVRS
jgi:hydrogenase maturation protein HypF